MTAALNNALQNAFGKDITVFVDRVSIQQGDNIRQVIEANLAKSDVLAIVSTGTERPSHDWAGFELGYFAARIPSRSQADRFGERSSLWLPQAKILDPTAAT